VAIVVSVLTVIVLLGTFTSRPVSASTPVSGRAAAIQVTPAAGLYDQARSIVISHLSAGEVVNVTARTARPNGTWSANATFKANQSGVVDLARDAPLSGSYRGVSAMGLFWAQHQTGPGSAPLNGRTVTTLTVAKGTKRLASTQATQLLEGKGVTERAERVGKVGFYGEYFTPAGTTRRPAVVLWGGSEGGLATASWAALLASHGIPTLALAYFDEPGLPCALSNIPLEYFEKAIRWLRLQPQVDPGRVWVMSGSRGSEAALLVASYSGSLVHGVVADAPSSDVYGPLPGTCAPTEPGSSWTYQGIPLAAATEDAADVLHNHDGSLSFAPAFLSGLPDTARDAQIPTGRIKGPVLLISGGDDQLWPSNTYADRIMASLHDDPSVHVHLNYPAAGHFVLGPPYVPTLNEERYGKNEVLALGGTNAAYDAAHQRDWPATITFVTTH